MDDLNEVRNRIAQRKRVVQTQSNNNQTFFSFCTLVYRVTMMFMVVCVISLGILINKELRFVDLTNMSGGQILQQVEDTLASVIPIHKKSKMVSSDIHVNKIKGNQFSFDTNQVVSLNDGIVVSVKQALNKTYTVTIQQDNMLFVTYANVKEVTIQEHERILQGCNFATYQNYVTMKFKYHNQEISYEQAIAL